MNMIVNATPHDINVVRLDGSIETIRKTELLVRVAVRNKVKEIINGIEYFEKEYGCVEFLFNGTKIDQIPPEFMGCEMVVSGMALEALKKEGNGDCIWLAPGELVRNEAGQPVGCRGFTT